MPLKVQTDPCSAVEPVFSDPEDQRNDFGRNLAPDAVWSSRLIRETPQAVLFKALLSDAGERPRISHESAGLADISAGALHMLQQAQPGLHLPRLDPLIGMVLHHGRSLVSFEDTPLSGMSISSYTILSSCFVNFFPIVKPLFQFTAIKS